MKASVLSGIIVILLIAGAVVFVVFGSKNDSTSINDTNSIEITNSEVASHNNRNDCWTIIDGNVYDITSYISRHSGGDNILSACGIDATEFFNGNKAGQDGGSNNHKSDSQALRDLAKLKKGKLKL